MVRPRVYLDTTVVSAYFDERAPDRQRLTLQFWADRLPDFEAAISVLVLAEIAATPLQSRRGDFQSIVQGFTVLPITDEADRLAGEYVQLGIVPEKYRSDALHVAIAVVHGISYLASWNFRHLVKVATRREVNLLNSLKGYEPIEIVAPPEL